MSDCVVKGGQRSQRQVELSDVVTGPGVDREVVIINDASNMKWFFHSRSTLMKRWCMFNRKNTVFTFPVDNVTCQSFPMLCNFVFMLLLSFTKCSVTSDDGINKKFS